MQLLSCQQCDSILLATVLVKRWSMTSSVPRRVHLVKGDARYMRLNVYQLHTCIRFVLSQVWQLVRTFWFDGSVVWLVLQMCSMCKMYTMMTALSQQQPGLGSFHTCTLVVLLRRCMCAS